jgi:hypothetical protein
MSLDHVETDSCLLFEQVVKMHCGEAEDSGLSGDREAFPVLDQD